MRGVNSLSGAAALVCLCGCKPMTIETKPIQIEPIHITMDVNIRVQRELDDFFDFETPPPGADKAETTHEDPEG